ncbi:MAG: hypothetical protein Phog2KO_27300 [Phototrophicaceae bacterium]
MDMIVKQVSDQLGLDEAIARQAVVIVVGMLKDKFPEPIASQLNAFLEGGEIGTGDDADGGIMGTIGGLFGKK